MVATFKLSLSYFAAPKSTVRWLKRRRSASHAYSTVTPEPFFSATLPFIWFCDQQIPATDLQCPHETRQRGPPHPHIVCIHKVGKITQAVMRMHEFIHSSYDSQALVCLHSLLSSAVSYLCVLGHPPGYDELDHPSFVAFD